MLSTPFQVLLNVVIIFLAVPVNFRMKEFNFFCQPVDRSDSPDSALLAKMSYCFFAIKFLDMADTAFFVLRKKNRQVCKLF